MKDIQRGFSGFAWIFFVFVIMIGNFFLLNLMLAAVKVRYSDSIANQKKRNSKTKIFDFRLLHNYKTVMIRKHALSLEASLKSKENLFTGMMRMIRFGKVDYSKRKTRNTTFIKAIKESATLECIYQIYSRFFEEKVPDNQLMYTMKNDYVELIVNNKLQKIFNSSDDVIPEKK